jgi:histidine phosphotransferase ChpT
MPKNRVKLLMNMLLIAGQAIPRGGQLAVDAIGEGDSMGFRITATGLNARVTQAVPALLAGGGGMTIDAHAIQPFYTGLLARSCGLNVTLAPEGDAVVVTAS